MTRSDHYKVKLGVTNDNDASNEHLSIEAEINFRLQQNDCNRKHEISIVNLWMNGTNFTHNYIKEIVSHKYFNGFFLIVIVANAAFIASSDYSHVDNNNNIISTGSIANTILIRSE
eukprot:gene15146-20399_t